MKNTKRIIAVGMCVVLSASLASCSSSKDSDEDETATVHFESASDAYEAMTGAVNEGKYKDAVKYYKSGADGALSADVSDWYLYSVAAKAYNENGCIGYPLDILENQISSDFQESKSALNELMILSRPFSGAFSSGNTYFLYIADGKISVNTEEQLSGAVAATGELVVKDDVFYWATHNADGSNNLLYSIEIVDEGLKLDAAFDNSDDTYASTYVPIAAEMPQLYY